MKPEVEQRSVIYTAILGGYDNVAFHPSEVQLEKYRFILFSDRIIRAPGWELVKISTMQPALCNRRIKMFPWEHMDARHCFYIDGHVFLGERYHELFSSLMQSEEVFAVQRHRQGGNVGAELIRCIDNRKLKKEAIQRVLDFGIDTKQIAVECGFIYRDSQSDLVRAHAQSWWRLFNSCCPRDQLIVWQAAIEAGLNIKTLNCSFNDSSNYLKVGRHKGARLRSISGRLSLARKALLTGLVF